MSSGLGFVVAQHVGFFPENTLGIAIKMYLVIEFVGREIERHDPLVACWLMRYLERPGAGRVVERIGYTNFVFFL